MGTSSSPLLYTANCFASSGFSEGEEKRKMKSVCLVLLAVVTFCVVDTDAQRNNVMIRRLHNNINNNNNNNTPSVEERLNMLEFQVETKGRWCATRDRAWTKANSVITYDRLTFSDTANMPIGNSPPLAVGTGIFTVPASGTWRVWFNFWSSVNNKQENSGALYLNGQKIPETEYRTRLDGASNMWVTGGREILYDAKINQQFSLKTEDNDNGLFNIVLCFEFVPV